jgi:hypothetical protein
VDTIVSEEHTDLYFRVAYLTSETPQRISFKTEKSTLKMETLFSFEMLISAYQTTPDYTVECNMNPEIRVYTDWFNVFLIISGGYL